MICKTCGFLKKKKKKQIVEHKEQYNMGGGAPNAWGGKWKNIYSKLFSKMEILEAKK